MESQSNLDMEVIWSHSLPKAGMNPKLDHIAQYIFLWRLWTYPQVKI